MKIRNDWRMWLLFFIGLATTIFATNYVKKDLDKISNAEFQFECKEISSKINLRLHAHERLLQSGVAFWAASDVVSKQDWHSFVKKSKIKEHFPGLLGTGFSLIVPAKELDQHCQQIRNSGFKDYKVWPEHKREIYTSIVMLEPFNEQNQRAFGYDMMTEAVRREAMERARDQDMVALSGKVLLVQESDTDVQAGNLMYAPVYDKNLPINSLEERRAAIIGWVYSPYRMNDLIQEILDDWDFKKNERALHLEIYDGLDHSPPSLLFESHSKEHRLNDSQIRFASQSVIDFNGHQWSLVFTQKNGNIFTDYPGMWTIFIGGIVISILFLLLAGSLSNTKYEAQYIAESVTKELKESERLLKQSQKIAQLGRYNLNITSGDWSSSEVLDLILGIDPKASHSVDTWMDLLHPDHREEMEVYLRKTVINNGFFDKEYKIIRPKDKQVRWVHGLGQLEYSEKQKPLRMIGTVRDITEQKLSEIEIKNISNRLQLATSAANIGVWDRDLKTFNIVWDETMFELFGFGNQSIDPTTAWEMALHPEDKARVQEEIEQAIKSKKEYHTEFRVVWPDQSVHHIKGYGFVSYDDKGNPIRILGVDMDITEQKKANEIIKKQHEHLEVMVAERTKKLSISENKLKKSLKEISDYKFALDESSIVAITNKQGIITFVNDKFCSISKFDRHELLGNSHKIINSGYHSDAFFIDLWQTISQGKVWRGEIKNNAKDGSIYWVDSTIVPLLDEKGKPYQYMALRFDITTKKIAQEAIMSAKELADSANRAKSEFIANMSHEIRTPMNAVIGFSELLSKSIKNKKQHSQVESIRNSGKTLLKIINDILDLSKIEAGKVEILPVLVNLPALMSEMENMFVLKAKEKHLFFAIEYESVLPKMLYIDEVRIRQILFNLIGNALKFTDKGHVIVTLDAHLHQQEDKQLDLLFRIEDTGMGIPENQQERIFEPFSQQENQSAKYGGTGLGLSITKKLIEKMGGSLELESETGKGSSFTFLLPNILISTEKAKITEDSFDHSEIIFEKANVLLADDNSENRKLIKDLLECSQIRFFEANDGKTAVHLAKQILPDIILMDLRMPVMDGYQATTLLKQDENTKSIPVLAISASTRKIMHKGRSKDIFSEYLMKPFNASDLFEKIKKYLPHKIIEKPKHEIFQKKNQKLTEKQILQLPHLIGILEKDFLPMHENISQSQMMDHIENFGNELKLLAKKYEINQLIKYAEDICCLVDNFEIEKLSILLKQFPQLTEQLKTRILTP